MSAPALAEPFEDAGDLTGCETGAADTACFVAAAGFETRLELRDFKGEQGQMIFNRLD